MVGRTFGLKEGDYMCRTDLFIVCLKESICCADRECSLIAQGRPSVWSNNDLQHVVLPELNTLLSHALNGIIYFKYGKKQRMLESTYLLSDSFQEKSISDLGKKLSELQRIYNSL